MDAATARELIRAGAAPTPLHHNCSGKHAAMLATAVHMGEPTDGYWRPDHPVQVRIARVLEDMTGCRLGPEVCGIDGCSVPNWAIPLQRPGAGVRPTSRWRRAWARARAVACRRIAEACWAHPDLVAGPGRLDTLVMARLPRQVLMKSGAEGVYCGALPERGLGFALKIDDGAKRAAEAAAIAVISGYTPPRPSWARPGISPIGAAQSSGRCAPRRARARTRCSGVGLSLRSGDLALCAVAVLGHELLASKRPQEFLQASG